MSQNNKSTGKITKIINGCLLRNHEIEENSYLWIQDGKIIDAFHAFFDERRQVDEVIDAQDHEGPEDKLEKDIALVAQGQLQNGRTAFCPTVVTSAPKVYSKVLPFLQHRPGNAKKGAEILGAHCEGPFISTEKKGAHDQTVIQDAKDGIASLDKAYGPELLKGGETVRIMTVAPEIAGMIDVVPKLIERNITVSIGHSVATIEQAEAGVAAGATFMTHLFNAMKPFHQRDPGMVGILGASDLPEPAQPERHPLPSSTSSSSGKNKPDSRPFYGVICDGVHVHPNSVRIAYYSHPKGCVLVIDALSAAGLEPGVHLLGGSEVEVRGNVSSGAYLKGTDTLAESTITIDHCGKFTRYTIVEALEAATLHPAQTLGIQATKGTLNPGSDANLVFLGDDLYVQRAFVHGVEVDLTKKKELR